VISPFYEYEYQIIVQISTCRPNKDLDYIFSNPTKAIAIRAARKEVPAYNFSFSATFFHLQHVDYTINSRDSFFHKIEGPQGPQPLIFGPTTIKAKSQSRAIKLNRGKHHYFLWEMLQMYAKAGTLNNAKHTALSLMARLSVWSVWFFYIIFYYIPNYKYWRIYFLKVGLDGLENLKQN
jgi:hypothetical protein